MLDKFSPKPQLKAINKINPVGLKLQFSLEENTARAEFVLNEKHQGEHGYIHEGIIALLLDEGMGWIARHSAGVDSVTARMEVDYHSLAKVGESLTMISRITKNTRRLLEVSVRIEHQDGASVAEGTCLQYIMGFNQTELANSSCLQDSESLT